MSVFTKPAILNGPREAIVSLIEVHESATMWLSDDAINAIRGCNLQ